MRQKQLIALSVLLLAGFAHANQPISQSVQPVLITPPALSEAQLQQLLGKLPKGTPGLRAGDKVTPFASAPPLSSLQIIQIRNARTVERISPFQTNTNNSFSQGTFEVISLEQGYGQSQASYGATTPRLYSSQFLCNPANWRVCRNGEPAEGFLHFWLVNSTGPNLFETWSVSINGSGTYRAKLYVK